MNAPTTAAQLLPELHLREVPAALLDALKAKGADMNAEDPLGNSAARLASGEIRTAAPR